MSLNSFRSSHYNFKGVSGDALTKKKNVTDIKSYKKN